MTEQAQTPATEGEGEGKPALEYRSSMEYFIAEAVRLDWLRIEEFGTGRKMAEAVEAMAQLALDFADQHPEAHKAGPWSDFRCRADWLHFISDQTRAPSGTVPKPGQTGDFVITYEGWAVHVSYRVFFGKMDHYEFRHYGKDGNTAPAPFSGSGYLSHFEGEGFTPSLGVEEVARRVIIANWNRFTPQEIEDAKQIDLF